MAITGCSGLLEPSLDSRAPAVTVSPIEEDQTATPATTFISVIDGDTIETSEGTVRIIGIDTPETAQCGHVVATSEIENRLTPGDPITLELPTGQNDRDRYDRLLRYVITADGQDLGMRQIEAGNAVARYDSIDGYPAHPNESAYRAAQIAQLGSDGSVLSPMCVKVAAALWGSASSAAPSAVPPAGVPDGGQAAGSWFSQYPSCAALKRNTAGDPIGPFNRDDPAQAEIYDWFQFGTGHRGDGDGDGFACE